MKPQSRWLHHKTNTSFTLLVLPGLVEREKQNATKEKRKMSMQISTLGLEEWRTEEEGKSDDGRGACQTSSATGWPSAVGPPPPRQRAGDTLCFPCRSGVQKLKHSGATFTLLRTSLPSFVTHGLLLWICYLMRCYFPALERPSMDSLTSWGM